MDIYLNGKKQNLKDVSFEDYINFIKNNKNIKLDFNFENKEIINKFKKGYDRLCNMDGCLKWDCRKLIYDSIDLKDRTANSNGLRERGFSEEYIKNIFTKREHEKVNQALKKFGVIKIKVKPDGTNFTTNAIPLCKHCGSEIKLSYNGKNNFTILSCSNENCPCTDYKHVYELIELPEETQKEIFLKNKESNRLCIEYWLKRGFSEEEGRKEISKIQSEYGKQVLGKNTIINKEFMLKKLGSVDSVEKHYKERSRFCIEYWLKRGFSEEEGRKEISKIQSEYATIYSKLRKDKTLYPDSRINRNSVGYWMAKGYNEEDSKLIISKQQSTFSLEKCIKKYGEDEGKKCWLARQKKWQKSLHENGNMTVGYSKISQDLFNRVLNEYPLIERDYVFYGSKNKEFNIYFNDKNYLYDFCDLNRRKIIEFNGDIYHGNPLLFEATEKPHPFKESTAQELWEKDKQKIKAAEQKGFSVLVVWENEYRTDAEKTLNKILNFIFDNGN